MAVSAPGVIEMNAATLASALTGGDMIERSRHLKNLTLTLLILMLLPGLASATTFSFGDIDATDEIQSIIIVGEGTGVTYTASTATTGTLVIDGYVSTINFLNKDSISITPGTVTFSSQLDLTVGAFVGPAFNVAAVTATLMNGMTDDFSIIDNVGGVPVLGGNYDGPMNMTAIGGPVGLPQLSLNANLGAGLSGDGDVLSAFGSQGVIEFQVVLGSGSLCTTILSCPAPLAPGTPSLNSFSGPPNGSIAPVIPEPSTGLLLGAGLAGLTLHRRRRTLR
jgi:hypothetical protein